MRIEGSRVAVLTEYFKVQGSGNSGLGLWGLGSRGQFM